MRDAEGTVVHREDIAEDNDTTTATGVSGLWSIGIEFLDTEGGFAFTLTTVP